MLSRLTRFTSIAKIGSGLDNFYTLPYLQNPLKTFNGHRNKHVVPKRFNFISELEKINELKTNEVSLEEQLTTQSLIKKVKSSILWANYTSKNENEAILNQVYAYTSTYLNSALKILLLDSNRVKLMTMSELNYLLETIVKSPSWVHSRLSQKADNFLELIFENIDYKGGYDQFTLKSLFPLIYFSEDNANLYMKLTNYLIRDNFRFSEHNLKSLIHYLSYYKQSHVNDALHSHLSTHHPDLLTETIYQQFIKGHSIDMDLEASEEYASKVKSAKLKLSPSSINSLIHGYGRSKNYSKLIEILNELLTTSEHSGRPLAQVQTILSYISKPQSNHHIIDKTIEKVQEFEKDLDYFNIMIHYKVLKGDVQSAKDILKNMENQGILPNTNSFHPIISYYVDEENLPEASQLFFDFKESLESSHKRSNGKPRKIGKIIFNRLISLACKLQNPNLAEEFIDIAKKMGASLTPYSFSPLLECYYQLGNYSKVFRLYEDIKNFKFGFNMVLFDIYLKSIYSSGDLNLGKEEFFKMLETTNYVQPDETIIMTNAYGIGQSGTVEDVIEFFNNPKIKEFISYECYKSAYTGLQKNPYYSKNGENIDKIEKFKLSLILMKLKNPS